MQLSNVPYLSVAAPQTHPDRFATLASLFGLQPAPVDDCRVLELGCNDGSNLLPMALELPDSTFVGVDLAGEPIAQGQARAETLEVANLTLRPLDIMDVPAEWEPFDYIVAHGLYSWVPDAVRDHILALCHSLLAPQGVALVSYNTYPGQHFYHLSREMMRFHVQDIDDPQERIRQARALMQFLQDGQPESQADQPERHFYQQYLQHEAQRINRLPDFYLHHGLLAEVNAPCYFHEFVAHAAEHGLQYLAEAEYSTMQARSFPASVRETLTAMSDDPVRAEQYLDFLLGRAFRQTLLCREEVELDYTPRPDRLRVFYVGAPVSCEDAGTGALKMHSYPGGGIQTNDPLVMAVGRTLEAQWPRYVSFDELLDGVKGHLTDASVDTQGELADSLSRLLMDLYADRFVDLRTQPPPVADAVSEQPVASPLARRQQTTDGPVINLHHRPVSLDDPVAAALLPLLDGSRDAAALREAVQADGDSEGHDVSEEEVKRGLAYLHQQALLRA